MDWQSNGGRRRMMVRMLGPVLAVFLLGLSVTAQVGQVAKIDQEMINKIRADGMERSQIMDTLSWLTDVVGYRLTGSPNMKKANEWTKAKLAEWG
ncbi:MAG: hypothetical protein ACK5RS_09145 [Acidobacteriota bacterium]